MVELVNIDGLFEYYSSEFQGLKILFRKNKSSEEIEVRLDDNFAKAMGFESIKNFIIRCVSGLDIAPQWAKVLDDGSFVITTPNIWPMSESKN